MKIYKLFIISSVIFLVNAIFIFVLFYYQPPYQKLDIDIATSRGMSWDTNGGKIAYYSKKGNEIMINAYDFKSRDVQIVFSRPTKEIDTSSSLGFSQDNKYLSYFEQINYENSIDIIDIKNKKSAIKNIFSGKENLLKTDNSGPKKAIAWIDDRHVVYERYVPFERTRLVSLDIISGEEKFIAYGEKPTVSPDKKYLAYAGNQGIVWMDFKTGKTDTFNKTVNSYIHSLSWSPDSSLIAISYQKTEDTFNGVAIWKKDSEPIFLSYQMEFASPKWLDNDNLLLARFEKEGFLIPSKIITGLYLYNIKSNAIRIISRRLRSENYYPRPNTNQVLYQFDYNVELIDVNRILAPKGIDAWRDKLGIIAK